MELGHAIKRIEAAGYDHLFLQQIGPDHAGFLELFDREVRHRLRAAAAGEKGWEGCRRSG